MKHELLWWFAGLILSVLCTLSIVALLLRNGLLDAWVPIGIAAGMIAFLVTIVVVTRWLERK